MLPALVLTCDKYHLFAAHMIVRYGVVWPSHPFTFHVPYQDRALSGLGLGSRVESRRTPGPIRATVLGLLDEFDAEAWVYWCVDDKYPIQFVQPAVAHLADAVSSDRLSGTGIDGVLLCRCRRMLQPQYLSGERREGPGGVTLLGRRDYSQIWLHQFLKVKVLRHLFLQLPETVAEAKALDALKDEVALPADHRLYVVEKNLAVFGESTTRGRVTSNCASSFRALGLAVPEGFVEDEGPDQVMGVISGAGRTP